MDKHDDTEGGPLIFDLGHDRWAFSHCHSEPVGETVDLSKYATLRGDDPYAARWNVSAMYQPPAWATPTLKPTSAPVPPRPVEPIIPADRYDEVAPLLGLEPPGTRVERALAYINVKRRGVQKPLDPKAVGWLDSDVIAEAKRLGWRG